MVELVLLEIESTHQRANGTIARVQCDERRLHLGHLGDPPGFVGIAEHPDYAARLDLNRSGRLGRQARLGRFESLARDGERFPVLPHGHHLLGAGLQHHRRHQIPVVRVVVQCRVDGLVPRGSFRGQCDVSLGSTVDLASLVVQNPTPDRLVSGLLLFGAKAGVHVQAAGVGFVTVLNHHRLADHLGHILRIERPLCTGGAQLQGLVFRLAGFFRRDEPVLHHPVDDVKLPDAGSLGIGDRVVCRRCLGQTGQHGRLGDADVLERLAIVDLGSCREAIGTLTQENLVHVDLQNLLLTEQVLQLEGQQNLVDLSGVALLRGQEDIARDLHRDGGGALALGLSQIGQRSTEHALVVHAMMLEETGILDGQYRVLHDLRDLVDGGEVTALFAKLPHQLSLCREYPQRQLGSIVGQLGHVGQVGVSHGQSDGHQDSDGGDACNDQSQQRYQRPHHPSTP